MAGGNVTIVQINTLTDDYANKVLKANPTKELYPPVQGQNDRISIWRGDIVQLQIGAITNAANTDLAGGGGICGAIFAAAGPKELKKACNKLKPCKPGDAVITSAFNLPCNYVIHAVGPDCGIPAQNNNKDALLRATYLRTLQLATEHDVKEIALCSISTKIYKFPIREATNIAMDTVRNFFTNDSSRDKLQRVIFCVFDDEAEMTYKTLAPIYFPPVPTITRTPTPPLPPLPPIDKGSSVKPKQAPTVPAPIINRKPPRPPPKKPETSSGHVLPADPNSIRIRTWGGVSSKNFMTDEKREELRPVSIIDRSPRLSRPGRRVRR